jgi:hypothetical protein
MAICFHFPDKSHNYHAGGEIIGKWGGVGIFKKESPYFKLM